jgi:hypothetical protein
MRASHHALIVAPTMLYQVVANNQGDAKAEEGRKADGRGYSSAIIDYAREAAAVARTEQGDPPLDGYR